MCCVCVVCVWCVLYDTCCVCGELCSVGGCCVSVVYVVCVLYGVSMYVVTRQKI